MKKRLVSAAVTVALFIGLIAGVTFQSSDKKEIKHFTAFFSVEGDNIDPDNDIKQLIAELNVRKPGLLDRIRTMQ